jgi:Tol biopolymer transport system component
MDKLDDLFRGFRSGVTAPSEDAVSAARELLLRGIGCFDHPRPSRPRRRRAFVAVAALILVGGLLVTPAVGIGGRLLALIESAPGPREVQAPVWSSGGRQIAFLSRRGESTFDLDVVNADGSGQRTLIHGATREPPSWSPDGLKIAFKSLRDNGVYTVNADGSGRQRLARDSKDPAWSPDGRTIAFFSGAKIYLMNADGSEHRALTRRPQAEVRDLAWSPDGRKLAFLRARAQGKGGCGPSCHDIYVVNSDGSGLRNLTAKLAVGIRLNLDPASDPAWSPDGQMIAFARLNPGLGEPIYVVKADGSRLRNLTPKPVGAYADPAWSPDGRKIAFVSDRDGNSEVYVMNANGSGQRSLTRNPAFDADPAWSADGRKIAFVSNRDGSYGIYIMNADGSGQRRLAQRSP